MNVNAYRIFEEPTHAEGIWKYLRRLCAEYDISIDSLLREFDRLMFEGAEPRAALIDAMWLLGMWDEEGDKIPGVVKHRVRCWITNIRIDRIPSVVVKCSRCGHAVESYGRTIKSVRRCLALLHQQCPQDESNYYLAEEDDRDEDIYG